MSSATVVRLPERSEVKIEDTWDLSKLFADDSAWETAFTEFEGMIGRFEKFQGTLDKGAKELAQCLQFDSSVDRLGERLGNYAYLKTTCLLYTSPSPRDRTRSRMPSSA